MMIKSKSRKILNIIVVSFLAVCFTLQLVIPFISYTSKQNKSIKEINDSSEYNLAIRNYQDISDLVTESLANDSILTSDDDNETIDQDQEVWVIVQGNDTSLLKSYLAKSRKESLNEYVTSHENMLYQNDLLSDQQEIYEKVKDYCLTPVKYNYTILLNGFSVAVKYKDVSKIENIPGVSNVIISEKYYPQVTESTTGSSITENAVHVYDTGIYKSNTNYNGSGTIVAILDTGLDYTHSAFQKQPVTDDVAYTHDDVAAIVEQTVAYQLSASKESGAFTLVTDDVYLSKKVPFAYDYADKDANVYPTNDHGTHVAGIITGSDDTITGVATEAQLAIMKVFADKDEGAETADILSALQDCILLNVDVINMSLGSSCGFARNSDEEHVNEIYDGIKAAGISLIVAASNDYSSAQGSDYGDTNLTSNPDSGTVGSPSTYAAAMSVASISGVKTPYFDLNGEAIYFTESSKTTGEQNHFMDEFLGNETSKTAEYVVIPGTGVSSDYMGIDVKGKIAVIKRGVITFEEKILTATAKGAIAAVIYNNQSGTIGMSVGNKITIPSCSISMDMGAKFEAQREGTLVFAKQNQAGPFMSNFSSWGVLPDLELKPDITAHGGDILSAVRGGYDRFSGTSMAAPNMAGATLLVRQYVKEKYPELNNVEVTELAYRLMMSTATIAYNEYGNPYSPRKQGAGIADILKTTTTDAYLWVEGSNKTKLSLGDDPSKSGHYVLTFNITNMSNKAQSYTVNSNLFTETVSSDGKTVAERAYMFDDYTQAVSVTGGIYSNGSVIVKGYDTATITVTIDLSSADKKYLDENFENGMYVEGYVMLSNDNPDGVSLNIPYCGFYGDWTVAPILDYTEYELDASKFDSAVLDDDKLKSAAYGSQPMGGFRYKISANEYKDAYWGLGNYGYNLADGYTKPQTMEEHASITENIEGLYQIRSIAAGLIRGAKYANMTIVDATTGELVFEKTSYDGRKSHYSGGRTPGYLDVELSAAEYGLKNNTKYTFTLECFLDWEGEQHNKKNVFTFDFYVDSERPVLIEDSTKVRIKEDVNKNKTYYLDMYVYDNHYLQCYSIATYDYLAADGTYVNKESLIENTIPIDSAMNYTNKVTLDITQYWKDIKESGKKIVVEFIDYARNESTYTFELPDTVANEISFSKDSIELKNNATYDLFEIATMNPSDSFKHLVTFTSSDEKVVRVKDGEVYGVGEEGESAVITATTENGATASITVTIKGKKKGTPTLESFDLGVSAHRMDQGEDYVVNAECKPWYYDASDVNVEWTTNNEKIATVTVDPENQFKATIHATGSGSVTITCKKPGSFISSSITIIVNEEFVVESRILKKYHGRGDENGVVTIPDDKGIMYIYNYAFFDNDYITKIIVPEGVKEIYQAAIYGCENLEEVVLPSSMEKIEKYGLAWNPNLKKVDLGGTKTIQNYGFVYDQSLTDIDLSKVRNIGIGGFYQCNSLESIDISNCGGLGELAFAYCSSLKNIVMTENTSLQGVRAFYHCTALTSISIPTNYVAKYAFAGSGLVDVTFTNAMTAIDDNAFLSCKSLRDVTFLKSITRIGEEAFADCTNLDYFYLPSGLSEVGNNAFAECDNLKTITVSKNAELSAIKNDIFGKTLVEKFIVEKGNKYLKSIDGILYDASGSELVLVPAGMNLTSFNVPEFVRVIDSYAFSGITTLESVVLNNVVELKEGAFASCTGLKTVTYGTALTTIGDKAFASCSNLETIAIPQTVKTIGAYAYNEACANSATFELVIPANVSSIGEGAFKAVAGINAVKFAENSKVTYISDKAFANGTNLVTVDLTNANIKAIGNEVFASNTALTSVKYPDSVTAIGESTYAECSSLTGLNLPKNITVIPAKTYYNCSALKAAAIPAKVTEIGAYAFFNCTAMTGVNLNNVKVIGDYAFSYCSLRTLASSNVEVVGAHAFEADTVLTSVKLANALILGDYAFNGCSTLATFTLTALEVAGNYAFANITATGFTTIALPAVKTIGNYAFYKSVLTTVTLPVVETIGKNAFEATGLTTFNVTKNVKLIGEEAFANTADLKTFTVESANKIYFIDANSVLYRNVANGFCELVAYPTARTKTKYTVLDNTVRIAASAFAYNTYLTEVEMPNTLTHIGDKAFYNTKITKYVFHSYEAPQLETTFIDEDTTAYMNFVTSITEATKTTLTMVVPSNAYLYNSYLYSLYFDTVEVDENDYAANSDTIKLKKIIASIPANVTAADKELVETAYEMYTYLPKDMKKLITDAEKAKLEAAYNAVKGLN